MAVASQRGRSTLPNHFPAPLTSYSTYIHVTHMQRAFRLNYASVNSGHVRLLSHVRGILLCTVSSRVSNDRTRTWSFIDYIHDENCRYL